MDNSISIDQNINRICQLDAEQWRQPITPNRRRTISNHLKEYLQIEHDNPNLIWLYTLMLENDLELHHGEVVEAMKQRVLEESRLTPLAWRYIANGTSNDFRVVLDSQDPGEEPEWSWRTLLAWLKVLSGLRFNAPIPEPLQELFLHDGLVVEQDNEEILFRGAWMGFDTLRSILEEAEKQLAVGNLKQFAETEMVDVITWLAATEPDMDNNQINNGWRYLAKVAAEWKSDLARKNDYQELKWDSVVPKMQIEDWIIEPVIDAWTLHRLAISQRHCGDRYVKGCQEGKDRIFVILNSEGKTVATLLLKAEYEDWVVSDIKGFANSEVATKIRLVGEEIARRYGNVVNPGFLH